MMPQGMHEAAVPENFNLISITGMHIGKQSFYGQGAGRFPTAYNVMQDCLDIRNGLTRFYTDKLRPARVDNSSIMRPYYVRVNGMDRWLQTRIDKMLDCGIITTPVAVSEIHAWARERKLTETGGFPGVAPLRMGKAMLKVAKFGGSSMADAGQYQKIRDIIRLIPRGAWWSFRRRVKRSAGDNKITDLLYLCYAHLQYGVSCDGIYQMIRERYGDIHRELGLRVDLEACSTACAVRWSRAFPAMSSSRAASTFPPCLWPITSLYVRGRRAVAVLPL